MKKTEGTPSEKEESMNEKTKRIYTVYLLSVSILALLITALRTVAVINSLDVSSGYFALGTGTHTAANILTAVAVVTSLTAGPLLAGRLEVKHRTPHLPTVFSSAFLAFLLLAFAFFHFCEISAEFRGGSEASTQTVLSSGIAIIFSVVGAFSFVISASSTAEYSARKAICASFVVLFCIMYTMFLYFEPRLPLNADVKLLAQMALLSASLFFLYDARIALGRPKWAARAAIGLVSVVITASVSIPNLIYYLLYRESVLETPIHDFLIFAFGLYIFARMTSLTSRAPKPAEGFLGEALEMSRLSDSEQLSFFTGGAPLPIESEEETEDAEQELLAPPAPPASAPTQPSEEPISEGAPTESERPIEEAVSDEEESEPLFRESESDLPLDDLFSAPADLDEETHENDVLTSGLAEESTEEE